MKFLLIGATDMIGSRITAEALSRGHEVTAATRSGRTALPPDPALTVAALDATVPAARRVRRQPVTTPPSSAMP
ncbi:hypothetical protein [Streptomyces sp. UG1]|uniref:hypothetical protein n=1 Tax=Streptomyces sp. UG1 TaxID=3417652 RepID=UPI003CEFA6D4